jgi:hypothetical protein
MILEIEVDGPTNSDLLFEPIGDRVRGRFQPSRVKLEAAGALAMQLPDGLPGQRLRLDTAAGRGAVIEPLAAPEHAATRATLARLVTGDAHATGDRLGFAPAVQEFPGVHVPTWLGWMLRAVRAGYARVVSGTLPDAVPADCKPRVFSSLSQPPAADARDLLIGELMRRLDALEKAKK